jgi:hypothetical protein
LRQERRGLVDDEEVMVLEEDADSGWWIVDSG